MFGLILVITKKPNVIHSYHFSKVKEEELPAYSEKIGHSLLVMGLATVLTGIINVAFASLFGWLIFIIGFVVGSLLFVKAQKTFNGGIF
jgi:Flp pilus assembly protein TadB